MALSLRDLVATVAERHGEALGPNDPIMVNVTVMQAVADALLSSLAQRQEDLSTAAREKLLVGVRSLIEAAQKAGAAASAASASQAAELVHQAGLDLGEDLRSLLEAATSELADRTAAAATATATARERSWRWTAGAVGLMAIVVLAAGAASYVLGRDHALATVRDEKAAAAWANTPEGLLARRFAAAGGLEVVARCRGVGWSEQHGVCYPYPEASGKVYGWRLPER